MNRNIIAGVLLRFFGDEEDPDSGAGDKEQGRDCGKGGASFALFFFNGLLVFDGMLVEGFFELVEEGLVVFSFETGVFLEGLVDKLVVVHGS
ncbi:hypothetical protein N9907_01175 [bacterium]|nr:hypothetical protein [bacterium]